VVGALDGRHHNPMVGANPPAVVTAVNPGVNATIQLLTSAATTNEAAHTTTTWWLDKANEWVRTIVGNSTQMNTADLVVPTVNIASTCNAYYTGNTINFYSAGGGCSNTAFSTVIVHEWGHGIDDRYGGISNATGDGLSEGWGDIFGLYIGDNPGLGIGFRIDGDGTHAHPARGPDHAAGDLAAVGNQDLLEHLRPLFSDRAGRRRGDLRGRRGAERLVVEVDAPVRVHRRGDAVHRAVSITGR